MCVAYVTLRCSRLFEIENTWIALSYWDYTTKVYWSYEIYLFLLSNDFLRVIRNRSNWIASDIQKCIGSVYNDIRSRAKIWLQWFNTLPRPRVWRKRLKVRIHLVFERFDFCEVFMSPACQWQWKTCFKYYLINLIIKLSIIMFYIV